MTEQRFRVEHSPLLRGEAQYVDDVDRPGQLWLSVVRSSVAHGLVRGIDSAAARRMPGVAAVLTAADLDAVPRIPIRVMPSPDLEARRQPVIARERVRYVGEPLAVVVGEDPYTAEEAAERVQPDIKAIAPALDAADTDPALWEPPIEGNELCRFHGVNGDVEAAFAAAATVVEGDFQVQRHSGMPMETRGVIAEWDTDGILHLWGPTKFIHFTRTTVADFFGEPAERVVCHRVHVGGMFGVRGEVYPEDFLVPWAARHTGRPVKWIEDRREHLIATNHAREQRQHVALALDAEGRFVGLRARGVMDMGAYPRPIGRRIVQIAIETLVGPYRIGAVDLLTKGMATNKTPIGTMRGPVSFETTFVRERLIDLAAGRLGMDPLEIRRRNLLGPEEIPYTLNLGPGMHAPVYDAGDYPRLIGDMLERAGHAEVLAELSARRAAGEHVGVGFAAFLDHSGLGVEESVEIELHPDGRIVVGTSAAEIGQGLATMLTRVVVDVLGVDPALVGILSGDSRAHSGGRGTFSSRSTMFVGSAAHNAAEALRDAAVARAADALGADPAVIAFTPTGFQHQKEALHWKDVAPLHFVGRHRSEAPSNGFGMHMAVVAVDPVTGGVDVQRLIVGFDCGRAIDMASVEGQLAGAAAMGIGGTLLEELRYDRQGQPLSTTFMDYLVPTSSEIPQIETHVFERDVVPGNPLGVRGVGEAGIMGVGGALANAVADAVGGASVDMRFTSLPLRPEAVLDALRRADERPVGTHHQGATS